MQNMTQTELEKQFDRVMYAGSTIYGIKPEPLVYSSSMRRGHLTAKAKLSADQHRVELTVDLFKLRDGESEYDVAVASRTADSVAEALMAIYESIPAISRDAKPHLRPLFMNLFFAVREILSNFIERDFLRLGKTRQAEETK